MQHTHSRRRFLKTSAAAVVTGLAAPYVFTADAEGQNVPRSKNDRFRIGAIGMRYQGSVITEKALEYGDVVARNTGIRTEVNRLVNRCMCEWQCILSSACECKNQAPPDTDPDAQARTTSDVGVLGVVVRRITDASGLEGPLGFSTDVTIDDADPAHVNVRARGRALDLQLTLNVQETVRTSLATSAIPRNRYTRRRRATSSISGVMSTPSTAAAGQSAASQAPMRPVPQARSSIALGADQSTLPSRSSRRMSISSWTVCS